MDLEPVEGDPFAGLGLLIPVDGDPFANPAAVNPPPLPADVRSSIESKPQYEEWQQQPTGIQDAGPDWGGNRLTPGSPYGADPQSYVNDLHNMGVGDWGFVDKRTRQTPPPTVEQLTGPHMGTPIGYSPDPMAPPFSALPILSI